jgi:hypothetical protein
MTRSEDDIDYALLVGSMVGKFGTLSERSETALCTLLSTYGKTPDEFWEDVKKLEQEKF